MSARPKRYWDTAGYARLDARIVAAMQAAGGSGPWTVCPCHGRPLLLDESWAGLVKRKRR